MQVGGSRTRYQMARCYLGGIQCCEVHWEQALSFKGMYSVASQIRTALVRSWDPSNIFRTHSHRELKIKFEIFNFCNNFWNFFLLSQCDWISFTILGTNLSYLTKILAFSQHMDIKECLYLISVLVNKQLHVLAVLPLWDRASGSHATGVWLGTIVSPDILTKREVTTTDQDRSRFLMDTVQSLYWLS
jgi:hypothetical protein